MSQIRQKKQLSIYDNISSLTDHELREALKSYEQKPGPITDSTRNLYRKKLASLMEAADKGDEPKTKIFEADDDDDTSDEDYNAQDEESEEEDDDEDDEDDIDEEGEGELINLLEDDAKLSRTSSDGETLTTSVILGSEAAPNRISRGIIVSIVSFFALIFSLYLYSRNNNKLAIPSEFKNLTKFLTILIVLSPIVYFVYWIFKFYRRRHHQEMQRVCGLVNEALELLQSPDNPKGLMPILHIRDTLLTPAERKTKKMGNLWSKAVKFIEEHESRVKVELVNIDGEDFRAWKWIGTKKI